MSVGFTLLAYLSCIILQNYQINVMFAVLDSLSEYSELQYSSAATNHPHTISESPLLTLPSLYSYYMIHYCYYGGRCLLTNEKLYIVLYQCSSLCRHKEANKCYHSFTLLLPRIRNESLAVCTLLVHVQPQCKNEQIIFTYPLLCDRRSLCKLLL